MLYCICMCVFVSCLTSQQTDSKRVLSQQQLKRNDKNALPYFSISHTPEIPCSHSNLQKQLCLQHCCHFFFFLPTSTSHTFAHFCSISHLSGKACCKTAVGELRRLEPEEVGVCCVSWFRVIRENWATHSERAEDQFYIMLYMCVCLLGYML